MIKVGIVGAERADAGELLRLLISHPEVEIKCLLSPAYAGRNVSARHHGFIGEDIPKFSDKIDPSALDVIFIADNSHAGREILARSQEWDKLRIIDMSPLRMENWEANGLEYGLSEMNRKSLVRGARLAVVPSATASAALIALYPLAAHLLLISDIDITVALPAEMERTVDCNASAKEIATMLSKAQTSFNGKVTVSVVPSDFYRTMRVRCRMNCSLDISEIDNVYESVYDDHSFVFTSISDVDSKETEGTHKCIVSFRKQNDMLELEAVADCHIRGGAGDALHVLNLFFALDEKVGLRLKPSCFGNEYGDAPQQTSWFA